MRQLIHSTCHDSDLAPFQVFNLREKKRVLIKAYFESQFKYCPLVWMFHGRQVNNKINCRHERALRMIYEDSTSPFDTLLEKDM